MAEGRRLDRGAGIMIPRGSFPMTSARLAASGLEPGTAIKVKKRQAAYRHRIRLAQLARQHRMTLLSRESMLDEAPPNHLEEIGRRGGNA